MSKKKGMIEFVIDDFKSDIKFIREVFSGERDLKPKYSLGEFLDIRPAIKENWLFFLLIILAFFVGYYFSAQHYQDVCNTIIIDIVDKVNSQYNIYYNYTGLPT